MLTDHLAAYQPAPTPTAEVPCGWCDHVHGEGFPFCDRPGPDDRPCICASLTASRAEEPTPSPAERTPTALVQAVAEALHADWCREFAGCTRVGSGDVRRAEAVVAALVPLIRAQVAAEIRAFILRNPSECHCPADEWCTECAYLDGLRAAVRISEGTDR
jgi:hypothetical protein